LPDHRTCHLLGTPRPLRRAGFDDPHHRVRPCHRRRLRVHHVGRTHPCLAPAQQFPGLHDLRLHRPCRVSHLQADIKQERLPLAVAHHAVLEISVRHKPLPRKRGLGRRHVPHESVGLVFTRIADPVHRVTGVQQERRSPRSRLFCARGAGVRQVDYLLFAGLAAFAR